MNRNRAYFPWLICALGAVFYGYEYFLRITPSVMAPELMGIFNVDAFAFGNLVAFYYYAYTPMQLPVGMLMDRYGPRWLLTFAALVCALGAFLFAHSTLWLAYLGRFLVGFGSAFAFVGVLKLAAQWLPVRRFAMVAGLATSLGMLGAMGGTVVIGYIVQSIGWQTTIYASAVVGILVATIIWTVIPRHPQPGHLQSGHPQPGHPQGAPLQLFKELGLLIKNPQMWLIGMVGFLLYLPLSVFAELWGVPYLMRAYGLTDGTAAKIVFMLFLGWAIGGPIMGAISDKIDSRRLPVISGSLIALLFVCTILYWPSFASHHLALLFFLFGVATSAQVIIFAAANDIITPNLAGTAMALTNMLVMLGGVLFQPLLGALLVWFSGSDVRGDLSVYSGKDFRQALIILPLGLILAASLMFFIRKPKR